MRVLIQVVTKTDITSLRSEISKSDRMESFGLRLAYSRKLGRKNGWTKLKSSDKEVLGAVNVRWDASLALMMCVVTTRTDSMPSALMAAFLHYILADYGHEIASVNIVPRG